MMYSDNHINIDSVQSYSYPYYMSYEDYSVGDLRLYTNTCALPLCPVPVVDSVVTDYETATIVWSGYSDEYQLTYPSAGGTGLVMVTDNSYTLSGLQPATTYQVSLRQSCSADSLGFSDWVTVEFTTDSVVCPAPEGFSVDSITYTSATFDWLPAGNDSLYQLYIWQDGFRSVTYFTSSHPFTVQNLMPGVTYNASVHGYCGSVGQIAGSRSDTLRFTTTSCPVITGLEPSSVSATSVTLSWNAEPTAQDYLLEYGPAGFLPGQGSQVTLTTNTYTVTGLLPNSAYDFYVTTGYDVTSSVSASLTNVRTLQDVRIDLADTSRLSFSLFPNPAKGVTTLTINGWNSDEGKNVSITISDLAGRDVFTQQFDCPGDCSIELDLRTLPQGAYFIRIQGKNNPVVRKLILE